MLYSQKSFGVRPSFATRHIPSALICGCPFLGSRPIPYDVGIACIERAGTSRCREPVTRLAGAIAPSPQAMPPSSHSVSARIAMTRRSGGQQTRRGTYANGSSNFATVTRHRPTTRTAVRESRPRTSANSSPLQRITDMSPVRPAWQPGGPTGLERPEGKAARTDDHPEYAGDGHSEGWRAALPQLQTLWERHAERWPAEQQSPVDRSTDEPGSWRGETAVTSITRRISLPGTRWTGCARRSLE